jgi:hypothetical protein
MKDIQSLQNLITKIGTLYKNSDKELKIKVGLKMSNWTKRINNKTSCF